MTRTDWLLLFIAAEQAALVMAVFGFLSRRISRECENRVVLHERLLHDCQGVHR